MSDVNCRRALYGRMAGDTTLTGMLASPPAGWSKSIFYDVAPEGATWPYVIFQVQAETPRYAMSAVAYENDVWTIKGVDKSTSADVVDNIASRLNTLLTDAALSISGSTHLYLRRESGVRYPEVRDGVLYRHAGAMFRFAYQTP